MGVTTKYNVGQEVWIMHNNRPLKADIKSISIEKQINYIFCVTYTRYKREKSVPEEFVSKSLEGLRDVVFNLTSNKM